MLRAFDTSVKHLNIQPSNFWKMTQAEYLYLISDHGPDAPMLKDELNDLMEKYPDK
jgi:uncharacterized phage protein (TIGR02216 family)